MSSFLCLTSSLLSCVQNREHFHPPYFIQRHFFYLFYLGGSANTGSSVSNPVPQLLYLSVHLISCPSIDNYNSMQLVGLVWRLKVGMCLFEDLSPILGAQQVLIALNIVIFPSVSLFFLLSIFSMPLGPILCWAGAQQIFVIFIFVK